MSVIYKVLSSMDLEIRRQESISKNLAGAPIPGYKGETVISSDFDGYVNQFSQTGQGTVYESTTVDFNPGPLKNTERTLDFALTKDGFFEVTNSNGDQFYTRNGRFSLSPDGTLMTADGYVVSGKGGSIQFPNDADISNLSVTESGKLAINGNVIGTLKVVEAVNLKNLERVSSSYFRSKPGTENQVSTMDEDKVKILGRSLEESNISIVKEMVTMIDTMRKYEMASRILKASDGLSSKEQSTFG